MLRGHVWKHGLNKDHHKQVCGFDDIGTATQVVKEKTIPDSDSFLLAHVRQKALWIVLALVYAMQDEGDDKEELTPSELLDSLTVEATSDDDDDENDSSYYDLMTNSVADALRSLGVDDTTINDAFGDSVESADSAIEAISETVLANLPDDGEPLNTFTDDFIFGVDATDEDYDAMNGQHTQKQVNGKKIHYVGAVAIRHGKRVVINKRMQGQKVRLTQKQKGALKKMRMKAFSANAMRRRIKSFKKGVKLGLHNK